MMRLATLLFLLVFISCTGNQQEKQTPIEQTPELPELKVLTVEMDIESSDPENFKLIANDIFLNNGQSMDLYITQRINPNESTKKIKFQLPDNIVPDFNLGISLGPKKIKKVKINSISISMGNVSYQIDAKNLVTYFRPNKFVDYDDDTGALTTKKIDGKHNPILFLRKPYVDKIESNN